MKRHFFNGYPHKPVKGNCIHCGKKAQDKVHLFKGNVITNVQVGTYFHWSIGDKRIIIFRELMERVQQRLFGEKKNLQNKDKWMVIKITKQELDKELEQIKISQIYTPNPSQTSGGP